MKVTFNWLKDYVDIDITPYELSEKLVRSGFEVEEIINLSDSIKNVVTGRILSSEKHPEADRLSVCRVDVGGRELQIVCGADNAHSGLIVPVALNNAVLPDGTVIKEGKIRNVTSYGMMCGGSELGLTDADYEGAGYDGLFILPENTPLGVDFNLIIDNDDYVMDINVTANRPDCNSIIGIAREIAAILRKPLKKLPILYNSSKENIDNYLSVKVQDGDLCPRYMAKVVKNVKIKRSPDFIRRRLSAVGLRPINNVVDITNYVLIEIGQPMHAFDIRHLEGNQIIVRRAKNDESIVALDGNSYQLNDNNLVICDAVKPVALAGIMGGENSSIVSDTSTIVFESARFNRENIRCSSRELNLRSDSSARFEKGIDYISQEQGILRALTLLNMGEAVQGAIDVLSDEIKENQIVFSPDRINSILGIKIKTDSMLEILNALSIKSVKDGKNIVCVIPAYREDILGVNDIAEEIIRMYGYDAIEGDKIPLRGGKSIEMSIFDKVKNILIGESMNEIITYSFITSKAFEYLKLKDNSPLRNAIRLKNPLGEDLSIMRTTLAHSMLTIIASNIAKGNKEGRLFEIARTYIADKLPLEELPDEKEMLALSVFGEKDDFFDLKGIIENVYEVAGIGVKFERADIEYLHPGISAYIKKGKDIIGYLGEIHPDVADNYGIKGKVYLSELDMKAITENFVRIKEFIPIPKYPSIERDLALVMDQNTAIGDIIYYIKGFNPMIKNVALFDIYRGNQIEENKKSVALSIELRNNDRTLRIEETIPVMENLIKEIKLRFNAKLRE